MGFLLGLEGETGPFSGRLAPLVVAAINQTARAAQSSVCTTLSRVAQTFRVTTWALEWFWRVVAAALLLRKRTCLLLAEIVTWIGGGGGFAESKFEGSGRELLSQEYPHEFYAPRPVLAVPAPILPSLAFTVQPSESFSGMFGRRRISSDAISAFLIPAASGAAATAGAIVRSFVNGFLGRWDCSSSGRSSSVGQLHVACHPGTNQSDGFVPRPCCHCGCTGCCKSRNQDLLARQRNTLACMDGQLPCACNMAFALAILTWLRLHRTPDIVSPAVFQSQLKDELFSQLGFDFKKRSSLGVTRRQEA